MTDTNNGRAVVLLSGGLDSTTVLAVASQQESQTDITVVSFDYQQRHRRELESARMVAKHYEVVQHVIIRLPAWGGSALNDPNIEVAKDRPIAEMSESIPTSYVPARNTIFLGFAAAVAEVNHCGRIYAGMNALDYSGYPDCRPEFVTAFQEVLDVGTKRGTEGRASEIRAPLIDLDKEEIIRLGFRLGAPYHLTHSCYDPIGHYACGRCDSCRIRLDGFERAGRTDPISYVPAGVGA